MARERRNEGICVKVIIARHSVEWRVTTSKTLGHSKQNWCKWRLCFHWLLIKGCLSAKKKPLALLTSEYGALLDERAAHFVRRSCDGHIQSPNASIWPKALTFHTIHWEVSDVIVSVCEKTTNSIQDVRQLIIKVLRQFKRQNSESIRAMSSPRLAVLVHNAARHQQTCQFPQHLPKKDTTCKCIDPIESIRRTSIFAGVAL